MGMAVQGDITYLGKFYRCFFELRMYFKKWEDKMGRQSDTVNSTRWVNSMGPSVTMLVQQLSKLTLISDFSYKTRPPLKAFL